MVKSKSKQELPKVKKQLSQSGPVLNSILIGDVDILQFVSPLLTTALPLSQSPLVLILTSQREKILSLKSCLKKNSSFSITTLTPGTGTNTEISALQKPSQILIACPDRLFFHMGSQNPVNLSLVKYFFIDQFDQLLNSCHKELLEALVNKSSNEVFLQIQANQLTEGLKLFSEKRKDLQVVNRQVDLPEIQTAQQYALVDPDKKFLLLHTFLFKNQQKKTVVVFNTSNEVIFFSEMLEELGIQSKSSHSLKTVEKNKATHEGFLAQPSGILLSTYECLQGVKNIAKDLLLVFDLNEDNKLVICIEQVSCVSGKVILFVVQQEKEILARVFPKAREMKVPNNKIWNVQDKVEKIVRRNYEMHKKAREGYKNYILSTKLKDYHKIAKNFGLEKAFLVNNLS